jgi:hypothetical protein
MAEGGEIYNPKNIKVGDYVEYQKWYYNWVYTIKGKVIEIVESEFWFPNTNYKKARAKILIETKFGQRGALPHQKTTTIDISNTINKKIIIDGSNLTITINDSNSIGFNGLFTGGGNNLSNIITLQNFNIIVNT